jgi:hypothetical protein
MPELDGSVVDGHDLGAWPDMPDMLAGAVLELGVDGHVGVAAPLMGCWPLCKLDAGVVFQPPGVVVVEAFVPG